MVRARFAPSAYHLGMALRKSLAATASHEIELPQRVSLTERVIGNTETVHKRASGRFKFKIQLLNPKKRTTSRLMARLVLPGSTSGLLVIRPEGCPSAKSHAKRITSGQHTEEKKSTIPALGGPGGPFRMSNACKRQVLAVTLLFVFRVAFCILRPICAGDRDAGRHARDRDSFAGSPAFGTFNRDCRE